MIVGSQAWETLAVRHPESRIRATWRPTGNVYFPSAARVGDVWWVLRINGFPEHPLFTLFADGHRKYDLDVLPHRWAQTDRPLSHSETNSALREIQSFINYGSEVGQACDNPFCCG